MEKHQGNMAHREKDKESMLLETRGQLSDEVVDSNFRRHLRRTRSASVSIPMASLESYEKGTSLVGHTGPLRSVKKNPFVQMSGPYATNGTGNLSRQSIDGTGNKVVENKTEKFSNFDSTNENRWDNKNDRENEHLMRSGQQGMCNDPYCTTCPTYFKAYQSQPRTQKTSTIFDPRFHNNLYGDAKGFGRKLLSFCSPYVPGVMNPHAKIIQQWNRFLTMFCFLAIFVDPLFFFSIYVKKDEKCIATNRKMRAILIPFISIADLIYFFDILLQFRLAYVSESRGVGSGDLEDHPKKIALNYMMKGLFFLDLFAVLPLLQTLMILLPTFLTSDGPDYFRVLGAVIWGQFSCRVIRFLYIGRSTTGFVHTWAKDIKNVLIFMLFGHLVGSCWYLFGIQRVNECFQNACNNSNITGCSTFIGCSNTRKNSDLWTNNRNVIACLTSTGDFSYGINEDALPLIIETELFYKYLFALFWGFQQVLSLADNLKPTYDVPLEVCLVMAIMALGLVFYALLIGNIQGYLQTLRQRRLGKELRVHDVEQWMSHRRIPEDLRKRIIEAEHYNWAVTKGVHEEMLFENWPEDLQTDIRRHLFKFVKKVPIFGMMNEHIFDAVCERFRKKAYIKRSRILSEGAFIEKMVFVVRGKLESIGTDGTELPLSDGDVCGEELLRWYLEHAFVSTDDEKVRFRGPRLISSRTIRCITNVETFSLKLADLEDLTILFPEFLENLRGTIR